MTIDQFRQTLANQQPPEGVSEALRALWEDARGNWGSAHRIVQDITDDTGSWIHAYLHRKEGDVGNAGYWYRRAGKPVAHDDLEREWDRIVSSLLGAGSTALDDK
jgi:hypothetical protein